MSFHGAATRPRGDPHQPADNCSADGSLNYVGSDPRTFCKFEPRHLTLSFRQDFLHNGLKYGKLGLCLKLAEPRGRQS